MKKLLTALLLFALLLPCALAQTMPLWACLALTKIIVKEGSFAQRYCQENGLPFAGE